MPRSLQANDWQPAAQWLPWSDRFDASAPDIAERRKQHTLQREQEQREWCPPFVAAMHFASAFTGTAQMRHIGLLMPSVRKVLRWAP